MSPKKDNMKAQEHTEARPDSKADNKEARLQRLRELSDDPDGRAAYATTLLQPRYGLEVVRAALRVLVARPYPASREALVRLFDHYSTQGVLRDPGTYVRSEIMRALRPICEMGDLDILEVALMTYEFPAPAFKEEAALLRSGALVTMAEIDDVRARFHATRLLADPLTDPMSGEPALTAVTVLEAQGELLPLYFYAAQDISHMHTEVASACLRSLGPLPVDALPPLLALYATCDHPVLLVGLIDLLLAHPDLANSREKLARMMLDVKDLDLYRYLVTALIGTGHLELRKMVLDAASGILPNGKQEVLLEVFQEASDADDLRAATAALQTRRSHRPA